MLMHSFATSFMLVNMRHAKAHANHSVDLWPNQNIHVRNGNETVCQHFFVFADIFNNQQSNMILSFINFRKAPQFSMLPLGPCQC